MIDGVIELPLPGRTLCAAAEDGHQRVPRGAVPSFVAGPENRVAATAIGALLSPAADDTAAARPTVLAIFGPSGTGKTHLARGLVRSWQERFGAASAEYLTAADFRLALCCAIKNKATKEFRARLRGLQLLAIDDLDRLPRDEYLQRELRSTIDACEENGGLLVVASTAAPGALRNLSADVRSRLLAGLALRLAPPEDAARERIIRHASALVGRELSEPAARRLAAGVSGTANDLFGALFELNADRSGSMAGDVRRVDRYLAARSARRPTLSAILRTVGRHYGVPQNVLRSASRKQAVVFARAMAVYLARELAGLTYEQIGAALGGRDHATVLYNYRKIARCLERDSACRDAFDRLRAELEHEPGKPR